MARITLHIEAEDSADLVLSLRELVGAPTVRQMVQDGEIDIVRGATAEEARASWIAAEEQAAASGEPQRRTRRTKAQIEADNAAAVAATSSGEATQPASESGTAAGLPATGAATSEGESSPPTSNASPASLAEVRNAMAAHLDREGKSAATAMVVLGEFKTETGDAVKRATELQAKDYAAAIEKLSA